MLSCSAEAEDAKKPSSGERPAGNLPSTLTRPCVVRSKVEDPEVLRRRQEMQQSKSIHELSKISNVNEIPLPFKLPLPDWMRQRGLSVWGIQTGPFSAL